MGVVWGGVGEEGSQTVARAHETMAARVTDRRAGRRAGGGTSPSQTLPSLLLFYDNHDLTRVELSSVELSRFYCDIVCF